MRQLLRFGFWTILTVTILSVAPEVRSDSPPGEFHLLAQANGGYFSASPSGTGTTTKTGHQIHLGAAGTYEPPSSQWTLLLGLTYFTQSVSYSLPAQNLGVNASTSAFSVEASPLFQISRALRVGPVLHLLLGTDLTFPRPFKASGTSVLAGAQVVYWPPNQWIFPFAQIETDLTVSNHSVLLAMVGARISLGGRLHRDGAAEPASASEPVARTSTKSAPAKPAEPAAETVAARQKPKPTRKAPKAAPSEDSEAKPARSQAPETLAVTLDQQMVGYLDEDGSLKPESTVFLSRLGKFLGRSSADWQRLEIVGHVQGPKAGKLWRQKAELRAQAVESALIDGGAPEFRLKSRGVLKVEPEEDAWIELRFSGVKNPEAIQDGIEKVKKAGQ